MDTKFRSESSNGESGPTSLDFPLFQGFFQWNEPTKRFPFTAEPKFSEILTKWKAPCTYLWLWCGGESDGGCSSPVLELGSGCDGCGTDSAFT